MPSRKYFHPILILLMVLSIAMTSQNSLGYIPIEETKESMFSTTSPVITLPGFAVSNTNDTLPARPLFSIKKTINATNVEPFTWIEVNLNITNIGNRTAYNLSLTEPDYEDWAVSTFNFTEQKYVRVDINSSFVYRYYLQPLLEGNFSLEATEIVYYDINGTEYRSYSQRFNIISLYPENIVVIDSVKWMNLFYFCLG
ncbi:MAG: hypothetical protein ACTSPI_08045, partial [Candidatus Heimdallarchaeaceae archaeon]